MKYLKSYYIILNKSQQKYFVKNNYKKFTKIYCNSIYLINSKIIR